jgi:hypothetical protein
MFSHGRSLLGLLVIIGLLALIPHGYGMMFSGLAVIAWLVFGLPPIVHRALIRKPLAERLSIYFRPAAASCGGSKKRR